MDVIVTTICLAVNLARLRTETDSELMKQQAQEAQEGRQTDSSDASGKVVRGGGQTVRAGSISGTVTRG